MRITQHFVLLFTVIIAFPAKSMSFDEIKSLWSGAGFTNVSVNQITTQYMSDLKLTYSLNLQLVVFRESEWTENAILNSLYTFESASSRDCGIALGKVTLIVVDSPTGSPDLHKVEKKTSMSSWQNSLREPKKRFILYQYGDDPPEDTDAFVATMVPKAARTSPIVFLIRDYFHLTGFAYGGNETSESYWGLDLSGTLWVSSDSLSPTSDPNHREYRFSAYQTLGHEIGHVLGLPHDSGPEKNFMTIPYREAVLRFTASQCKQMKESKFLTHFEKRQ